MPPGQQQSRCSLTSTRAVGRAADLRAPRIRELCRPGRAAPRITRLSSPSQQRAMEGKVTRSRQVSLPQSCRRGGGHSPPAKCPSFSPEQRLALSSPEARGRQHSCLDCSGSARRWRALRGAGAASAALAASSGAGSRAGLPRGSTQQAPESKTHGEDPTHLGAACGQESKLRLSQTEARVPGRVEVQAALPVGDSLPRQGP